MKLETIEICRDDPHFIDVDVDKGLSSTQVATRQKEKLVNKTKKTVTKSYGKILFDNFCNPFNLLLICITVVMIWGKLSLSHFFFAGVYGLNIAIGIYQDVHARILLERLKVISDNKAVVIRDGKETSVFVQQIVLSDIILYKQGDQIPADSIIIKGHCSCDESLLTGESMASAKGPGDPLYSGSFLRSGNCVAQVARVGGDSYAEKLRSTASTFARPKSEIAQSIWDITVTCALAALTYGIVFTIIAFLRKDVMWETLNPMSPGGSDFIASLSGSMVAMLPTGMFLLSSVALTTGVIALARKNMLVQELYCIEMLARVDTICFDKTGTLTDGDMSVTEFIPFHGHNEAEVGYAISALLKATGDDNVTARALKEKYGARSKAKILESVAFDPHKKYSAVCMTEIGSYVVGAYGFAPIKKEPEVELLLESYEKKGFRCLVVGYHENEISNGVLPKNFTLCGLLVLSDRIKPTAKSNIQWFQESGVTIYVISGDNPITVSEIAKQCGVNGAGDYVDMSAVKDEEIPNLVHTCRVFGRVSPEQKRLLVKAMQAEGHKVAMTGDGVNDILALKAADCSIAMASGSSAAKSVAHLVCTKSDFSSLPDVVAQGRRVINNLQRSCSLFLSKTAFAMLVSTAFLISVLCGGPRYPFTTSHMLVWEIFSIGLASFFLALQPNSERIEGSMIRNIFVRALPFGVAEAVCVAIPYLIYATAPGLISYNPEEVYAVTVSLCIVSFSIFSYATLFRVCLPFNRYRAIVFGASLAVGIAFFVTDYFIRVPDGIHQGEGVILRFMWGGFAWSYPLMMLLTLSCAAAVYFILAYFIEIRRKRRRITHDHLA